jgi:hypothetical protein
MKLFKRLALTCLTIAFFNGIHVIWRSYSEEFTHLSVKSEDGAQIHQRTHDNQYGAPIAGSYLIALPTGKFMSASNVREWLIIQVIFLVTGLACMIFALNKRIG